MNCKLRVWTKMHEKDRKRALNEELKFYKTLGLSVGFVPLRAPKRPLTVKCPMCQLIMLPIPNGDDYDYCCLECGIVGYSSHNNDYISWC